MTKNRCSFLDSEAFFSANYATAAHAAWAKHLGQPVDMTTELA